VTTSTPHHAPLGSSFARHTGTVRSFDDHRGCGVVSGDTGGDWYFHCTRIADGSRSIAVGTQVAFDVVPGPTGLEATGLRPASS
jgi:cold shock CspA family protein